MGKNSSFLIDMICNDVIFSLKVKIHKSKSKFVNCIVHFLVLILAWSQGDYVFGDGRAERVAVRQ